MGFMEGIFFGINSIICDMTPVREKQMGKNK